MRRVVLFLLIFLIAAGCTGSQRPTSPDGTAAPAMTTIVNKGSDTIVNLALAWAEKYHELHPNVEISVTGGGSGTGIAALINGTVDIANASRQITQGEIQQAESNGSEPVEFVIARDAIAIIVNPSNPISKLSIEQLSLIYTGKINNWSEVGGEDRVIVKLSRETNSGTHVFFLENVIRMGNPEDKAIFAADTVLLPSSEGITSEVRDNPNAIGYDGLGYVTPDVKVISVAAISSNEYVLPSADTVNNKKYPIARDLYMYTDNQPEGEIAKYLDWIRTPEAQTIVTDLGFVPILNP